MAQFVELAETWPTPVPIPNGCADAGSTRKLTLRCTARSCHGTANLDGKVHPLAGPHRRITIADHSPSLMLEGLQLDVLRTRTERVDVSALGRAPLRLELSFAQGRRKMSFQVSPGQGVWASLDPAHESRSLELIVERAPRGHARMRIWDLAGARLLDRTLRMSTPLTVRCETLADACAGILKLEVREPAPSAPVASHTADALE